MKIQKTIIIGMGALGMLYGTKILQARGETAVSFCMDADRIKKYSGRTFTCNGKAITYPMQDADTCKPADLVIVAVKYNSLASALETMKNCIGEQTILLSVMNGITSEEILGERYGKERVLYTVAQGMDAMKFGTALTYTRYGELRIGIREESQRPLLDAVSAFFDEIRMPYTIDADILHRMWGKFMLNVGINQTCMVYGTGYQGALVKGEANRTLIAAMREVIALSKETGINLSEKDLNEYIAILKTLSPDGVPSMAQDRIAKRKSEVEMFAGTVIAMAEKYGLYVPTNEFLYERVKEIEAGY